MASDPSDASLGTVIDKVLAEHESWFAGEGRAQCDCQADLYPLGASLDDIDIAHRAHVRDALTTALGAWERQVGAKALEDAAEVYGPAQISGFFVGADAYPRAWLRERAGRMRGAS